MKSTIQLTVVASILAIGTCAYAQQGFLRPEVSYNFASTSDSVVSLKDSAGFTVAGGAYFGSKNEHEVGLSVGVVNFDLKPVVISGVRVTGDVKTVPVLATYRYYLGARNDRVRLYAAPSAGWTFIKMSATGELSGITASDSDSETDFTWSLGVGVLVNVAPKFDIDAGYRYQQINAGGGHVNVSTIYAGLNWRF